MTAFFYPGYSLINAITNAQYAVITFINDHHFTPGEYVGIRVGTQFGMSEINNKTALVLSITSNTITTNVDTTSFNAFVYPVSGLTSPPMCVPSASGIIPGSNPPTVNLFDTFDDRPS